MNKLPTIMARVTFCDGVQWRLPMVVDLPRESYKRTCRVCGFSFYIDRDTTILPDGTRIDKFELTQISLEGRYK